MAPLTPRSFDLSEYLESLSLKEREELSHPQISNIKRDDETRSPGPWAVRVTSPADVHTDPRLVQLQARAATGPTGTPNHAGAIDPSNVNMKAVQASFALIGCGMVIGAIWFFFWAKNGGFVWRKGDWDEYKSTVLRRKGPNGTTLSNATKSTILGGGSVVGSGFSDRDSYRDETSTVYTGTMTELSSSTAPIIKEKQGTTYTGDKRSKRKKPSSRREETAKERKQREMQQAQFEGGHDADVRAYMKEKPARVGGINAASDTLHYGTDYTDTESSVGQSHHHRPQSHSYHNTAPAPPQHKPQPTRYVANNGRRDFSYTIGGQQQQEREQFSVRSDSPPPVRVPAGARSVAQEANTKSYHHPLPGLSGGRQGGFRRGAGDFDD